MEIEYKNGIKVNFAENSFNNNINQNNLCISGIEVNKKNIKNKNTSSNSISIGIATPSLDNNSKNKNNLKNFIKIDPDVCLSMLFENSSLLDQYRNAAKFPTSEFVNCFFIN